MSPCQYVFMIFLLFSTRFAVMLLPVSEVELTAKHLGIKHLKDTFNLELEGGHKVGNMNPHTCL